MDLAAFGHALHGAIRRATICPDDATDPFVLALRREVEGRHLIKAQILVLKNARFVESLAQLGQLQHQLLDRIGLPEATA